jgi:Fe-S cluster assembly ATP-binding protein
VPDIVHVLLNGRIVRSGTKELALELEDTGYAGLEKHVGAAAYAS